LTYSRQREMELPAVGEPEPEPSERRGRGRPRLEASIDHDLGSSRSSRDDVPPQMYDEEAVPHASEETVPHASTEGVGGSTSSAASIPYKRGPSHQPLK
jgi:hypothetical protein